MEDSVIDRFGGDRDLQNNTKRGKRAIALIIISSSIAFISLGYNLWLDMTNPPENDPIIDSKVIFGEQNPLHIARAFLPLITFCLGAAFFIQWFRGTYQNAVRLKGKKIVYVESWVLWSWFIPVWSWVAPIQMIWGIRSVYQDTLPEKGKGGLDISIWWTLWTLSSLGTFTAVILGPYHSFHEIAILIGNWTYPLSGVFAVLVIRYFLKKEQSIRAI